MLSHDLRDLYLQFSRWITGDGEAFTVDAARGFQQRLKHAAGRAALLELGVDPHVCDVEAPIEDVSPSAQVLTFPVGRIVRDPVSGGARR